MLQATYAAGDTLLADKITKSLRKDLQQQISYYDGLDEARNGLFNYVDQSGRKGGDRNSAEEFLMRMMALEQQFKNQPGLPTETPGQIKTQPVMPKDSQKK